ncbi:MAG: hypothetical protein J4215_06585 [Candidatus Diapherotrites archaeon]|uniref:Uncharacterized protein n=1 Tax=Candidatus Iainarchaeum sp. TaxID=3101447 RepID=A0A8T4LBY2_9ARCH|nr:hypothetical protein [Candidatus Diapherotrites archaeon]
MVITRIRRRVVNLQAGRVNRAQNRLERFTTHVSGQTFAGSRSFMARANKKVVNAQYNVQRLNAKLARIRSNIQGAENSWPIIRQLRRAFWNWRLGRASARLATKTQRLTAAQSYQAQRRAAMETTYQTKVDKRQAKVDNRFAEFDRTLNKLATTRPRLARLVEPKVQILEALNTNRAPAAPGAPAPVPLNPNLFVRLREKLNREVVNGDGRQGAFRILEIDRALDELQNAMVQNPADVAGQATELTRLINFRETPPPSPTPAAP